MFGKEKEVDAEIRNKLQVAITVLESLSQDKRVPKSIIDTGKKDLQEVLKILEDL